MAYGFVYFAGYSDRVKIGKTIDPKKRLRSYNTHSPEKVRIYAAVETHDSTALERRMHEHFKTLRIAGKREWYRLDSRFHFIINELMGIQNPSEFDLAVCLSENEALWNQADMKKLKEENLTLSRTVLTLQNRLHEFWAQDYALRVLNIRTFPLFVDCVKNGTALLSTIPVGDVPIFITDKKGNITVTCENDNDPVAA